MKNKVILEGSIDREPTRGEYDGRTRLSFTLIQSGKFTRYFPVTLWGRDADAWIGKLQPGMQIEIEAKLSTRQDKRYSVIREPDKHPWVMDLFEVKVVSAGGYEQAPNAFPSEDDVPF